MARGTLAPRPADLRAAMRAAGYTATHIAAQVGVTKQFMSLLLRGRRRCSPELAESMARELNTPVEALFSSSALSDSSHNTEEEHVSPAVLQPEDPYLLFDEAAAYTRIKPKTLRDLRAKGEGPPFFKRGHLLMIRRSKLQSWFEEMFEHAAD